MMYLKINAVNGYRNGEHTPILNNVGQPKTFIVGVGEMREESGVYTDGDRLVYIRGTQASYYVTQTIEELLANHVVNTSAAMAAPRNFRSVGSV